jgi:pyruvate/2-oxoglutarate dehydrogenase complex dihydrolipoamide acyltransferase (E2) component
MQQRQPRLGDILDDYCPRERRITNHAVVAMIGQEVKQTRCTTCDADHVYKHAKVPLPRRKKDTASAAYSEVLATVQQDAAVGVIRLADPAEDRPATRRDLKAVGLVPEAVAAQPEAGAAPAAEVAAAPAAPAAEPAAEPGAEADVEERGLDEGPVHRRLIRATLPRTADVPAARPVPQFTMRDPGPRAGHFRPKGSHRPHAGGGAGRQHGRPNGVKPAGPRKGGFGAHARPSRPGPGSHASRPGKKHSK